MLGRCIEGSPPSGLSSDGPVSSFQLAPGPLDEFSNFISVQTGLLTCRGLQGFADGMFGGCWDGDSWVTQR